MYFPLCWYTEHIAPKLFGWRFKKKKSDNACTSKTINIEPDKDPPTPRCRVIGLGVSLVTLSDIHVLQFFSPQNMFRWNDFR